MAQIINGDIATVKSSTLQAIAVDSNGNDIVTGLNVDTQVPVLYCIPVDENGDCII